MELNEFGRIARDEWIKTAEMRPYKSSVTKQIKIMNENPCMRIWQRNYYEHIIRDDVAYFRIREYIRNNPAKWIRDSNNPSPKNH